MTVVAIAPSAPMNYVFEDAGLDALRLDYYQRHATEKQQLLVDKRAQRMADDFDPNLMEPPIVSKRTDGSLWVVDGGNRVAMAKKLGWPTIRVRVLTGLGLESEARLFQDYNNPKVSKNLTPFERFNAGLYAKDPEALDIQNIMNGLELDWGVDVRSVVGVQSIYKDYGISVTYTTLDVLRSLGLQPIPHWAIKCVGKVVKDAGEFLDVNHLRETIAANLYSIERAWKRSSGTENRIAGARIIVNAYNRGLSNGRRLPRVA